MDTKDFPKESIIETRDIMEKRINEMKDQIDESFLALIQSYLTIDNNVDNMSKSLLYIAELLDKQEKKLEAMEQKFNKTSVLTISIGIIIVILIILTVTVF